MRFFNRIPVLVSSLAATLSLASPAALAQSDELDVDRLVSLMQGSYRTVGGEPQLVAHVAPINVVGLEHAMYFELARADDTANPFRQAVMSVLQGRGMTRLRVHDLPDNGLGGAVAGLWAAPDVFPTMESGDLTPHLDLLLEPDSNGFLGRTAYPYPTNRNGAVDLVSQMFVSPTELTIAEQGLDVEGQPAWSSPDGGYRFERFDPGVKVDRLEGGIVRIHLAQGNAAQTVQNGGQVAVHYSGWLDSGFRFATSREGEPIRPFVFRYPPQAIAGWNAGIQNLAVGDRRRLVVPAEMGYGERGNPRGQIPPNAPLIFDVECIWIQNPAAGAAAPTSTGVEHDHDGDGKPDHDAADHVDGGGE